MNISETGSLPGGVTFVNNNDGTATLAGTPNAGTGGTYPITITANNGVTPNATQGFTLTVTQSPAITSANNATFKVGVAGTFTVTTTGFPTGASMNISETGALPGGVTLVNNNDGTATLAGTPNAGTGGTYSITINASNGIAPDAAQSFTLTVNQAPSITSANNVTFQVGTLGTFTVTTTGFPTNASMNISESGALPSGVTLTNNNDGTATLTGTPNALTGGVYPITITANNGVTPNATQSFTLTVNEAPSITSANSYSAQTGSTLNFTFTTSGYPAPTLSQTGLPAGATFTDNGNGTATLGGSVSGGANTYPMTITATNGITPNGSQNFSLIITCPSFNIQRVGGGSFPAATYNVGYPAGNQFTANCVGCTGTIHWSFQSGAQPPGINLTIVAGTLSGIPSATGQFTMTVIATDTGTGCSGTASFPFTIKPNVTTNSYSNLVNNTEAYVTGGTTAAPTTPAVQLSGTLVANDTPSGGVTVDASSVGTFSTAQGGSVTIASDGTFKYTPPVTASALASDTFTYTGTSNTGTVPSIPQYAPSTGAATAGPVTVTLNLAGRVWYVKNNGSNGNGQSQSPCNSLTNFTSGARVSPDAANDIIYVYNGDGTTTNQNAGVSLLSGEQLIGQGVALVVNTNTLVTAGSAPLITNATANSDGVTLNAGNTVKGVTIQNATRDGIAGSSKAGFTADTVTIQNNTASGLHLTSMTGTVTVTNATISGNAVGLDVNNGTAAISLDNTNTITANAGQRQVSIQNRPASAGTIDLGATINDSVAGSTGILVNNNASGTINFTGNQTLRTTTNTAVNLTSNTGTTINFSGAGTLGITTTAGIGLNATGGGTLNVSNTANVTTGAASSGININGVTVGASGATFNSVNTTGATTGVGLTSIGNGNVTINSGTISGGTTGLSMSTLGTSTVTLGANAQTLTFTGSTTGISGSTFGTLAVASGSTVNVSGATALNLATGAVSGTFNNVSSTGGTNGVNLSAVTGSWGATTGSLTGATGSTFNVSGGSGGTISWGTTINQAGGANAVTIAGSNSNTINFSNNITTSTTSTGINISGSSGTYNFTGGTSTIAGSGGGITIANESGTISFGSGYTISASSPEFKIGGSATNTSANITYSGNMTPPGGGGTLIDVNSAAGTYNGTLLINGTTIGGNVGNPTGIKSVINNMTGTATINNLNLTSNNNTFSGTLLAIGGTNTAGSFTFNHLVLSANGNGHTGTGLTMSGGGTLTITATGGASSIDAGSTALSLTGVALGNSTLATVNSAAGTNGILLSNVSGGPFTITGGSLAGSTGSEVLVNGANAPTFSFGGTIANTNQYLVDVGPTTGITNGALTFSGTLGGAGGTAAGLGLRVQNGSGGSVTFSGTQNLGTNVANMTTQAVQLVSNAGSTINFSGTLSIFTSGAAAGFSTTAGTVNITGASNTVNTVNGTAFSWTNAGSTSGVTLNTINSTGSGAGLITSNSGTTNFTIGTLTTATGQAVNVTTGTGAFSFTKINSGTAAAGPATGIHVNGLNSPGSFAVNGAAGACDSTTQTCTGGTIQKSSVRGAEFLSSSGNLTLKNMWFKSNSTTVAAGCFANVASGTNTTCNGPLFLSGMTGTNTLNTLFLDGSSQMGLIGNNVNALSLTGSEVRNMGSVLSAEQTAVDLQNLTGTNSITGSHIHDSDFGHMIFITINTGSPTINFSNNTVDNVTVANPSQSDGFQVQAYGSANVTANVNNTGGTCTFNKLFSNAVTMAANQTSSLTGNLSNCTITKTSGVFFQSASSGTMNQTVSGNTITNKVSTDWTAAGNGSNGITIAKSTGSTVGTFVGSVTGNTINKALCGGGCMGIASSGGGNGSTTMTITNNTISNIDAEGIRFLAGGQSGGTSNNLITIQGNNLSAPAAGATYPVDVTLGTTSGDHPCVAANVGDMSVGHTVAANRNTITNGVNSWTTYNGTPGTTGNGPAISFLGNYAAGITGTFKVFNLSGGTNDAATQAWIVASNPSTSSDSFNGVAWVNGTTCP